MKRFILPGLMALSLAAIVASAISLAQQPPAAAPIGDGPWTYDTSERGTRIKVSVVTKGLSHPWSLVFLPDSSMLVTECPGRMRIIRAGVLDPQAHRSRRSVED